eukprot:403353988
MASPKQHQVDNYFRQSVLGIITQGNTDSSDEVVWTHKQKDTILIEKFKSKSPQRTQVNRERAQFVIKDSSKTRQSSTAQKRRKDDIFLTMNHMSDDVADEIPNQSEYENLQQGITTKVNAYNKLQQSILSPGEKKHMRNTQKAPFQLFSPTIKTTNLNFSDIQSPNMSQAMSRDSLLKVNYQLDINSRILSPNAAASYKQDSLVQTTKDFTLMADKALLKLQAAKEAILKKIELGKIQVQDSNQSITVINKENAIFQKQISDLLHKQQNLKDHISSLTQAVDEVYDKQQEKIDYYKFEVSQSHSNKQSFQQNLKNQQKDTNILQMTQNLKQQQKTQIEELEKREYQYNDIIQGLKNEIGRHQTKQNDVMKILANSFVQSSNVTNFSANTGVGSGQFNNSRQSKIIKRSSNNRSPNTNSIKTQISPRDTIISGNSYLQMDQKRKSFFSKI